MGDPEFLGLTDDQVKLRGYRIELGEVEAALRGAADVRDAVVMLRDNQTTGPRLVAYVVQEDGKPLQLKSLREHLAHRLPDYMVPAAYVQIQRVPRTINDKVDRAALPQPTATDYASTGACEALRDDLERSIAQIFSEVLDTTVTARESDFFRLGGDSLLALRVVIRCQELLNVDLSMSSIFDNPTLAAFADFVRKERNLERAAKSPAHVPRDHAIPLSPQQYALWLDLKIRADVNTYNEAIAFRVKGRLEPARLARALVRLAEAHEVLRARLVEVHDEPRLVFDRTASAIEFEFSEGGASDDTERKLTESTHRPFSLHEGPLWRAKLHNEFDGGSVLLLVVHHIILDAASEQILVSDLIDSYRNTDAPLPPRAYDFADLAALERIRLASEREALERFWAENLGGAELALDLPPPCVPCPPAAENSACNSRREIGPILTQRVRDLAASWGSTPFHIYLTAYLALLRKYTASDNLVVGSPVSFRDTLAAEGVVGYLLSPAALRVQLAGDRSFRETAGDVAHRWQEVRAHALLPMHLAVRAARNAQRSGIGSPIQVFFSLVQDPSDSLLIDGCALQRLHVSPAHAKFNLFLLVTERREGASLLLQFRRGTCDPEMGDRLLRHLELLLLAATENPELPLAKLPLADQTELAQVHDWGTHSTSYPRDRTVADIFEDVAREQKGKTAVVAGEYRVTYGELDSRANAVAAMLRKAGVGEGDRVPLLLPRGIQFITCALGVMKCGAAYVPLDASYPPERVRRMLKGLGARLGLRKAGLSICHGTLNWLDASLADDVSSIPAEPRQVRAGDPAYVMFTSGSTGRPKGVEVPHRAIVRLVFGQDFARMGPAETWLQMAPTSFDASTLEIWAPLLHGGRCVVFEEEIPTPRMVDKVIRRESVTSAWITSSLFNVLVDEAPACLSGLAQILVGGEALSPSHIRRALDHLPGVRLVNGYGPTENTTFTCCHVISCEDVDPGRTISIGRPIANTAVHVVDADGCPAPVGVPGELVAGGDGLALGYVGQPEMTSQNFLPDRFSAQLSARLYRTGDRVRWRPDGVLEFLGRFDNQVKIRGHRIEPDEVAACLAEHESVRQAVVISRLGAAGGAQLVACVVPQSTEYSAPEMLRLLTHHATERLPPYMVPTVFRFMHDLPLKPNGKVDFVALDDGQNDSEPTRINSPPTAVEARLLEILQELLRNGDLGRDDDFFEAGGDSLLAISLISRLESEFETELPSRVMEAFTARRLAAILESVSRSTYPAGVVEIRGGTTNRPIFCLPGLAGSRFEFRGLAAKMHTRRAILGIELHNLQVAPSVLESIEDTAKAVVGRMREVQPHGPYAILGYSFGGVLAVEVARQLTASGQTVELVAVIDAYAPGSSHSPSGLCKVAKHLRIIASLNPYKSCAYVLYRIKMRLLSLFPNSLKSGVEKRMIEASERGIRAYHAHRPEAFSGKIVLVKGSGPDPDDWMEIDDPSGTGGWSLICKGGLDVIPMACRHSEFLREPHLTDLARHINNMLNAIDGWTS